MQELKLEISALTNQVNEIRQQTESYNKKPVIDHTLISKLEELRKSDAEKTATVIRLKTELNHLQRTVEVIKTQSESNIRQFGDAMTTMGVVEQDSVRRRTGESCEEDLVFDVVDSRSHPIYSITLGAQGYTREVKAVQ